MFIGFSEISKDKVKPWVSTQGFFNFVFSTSKYCIMKKTFDFESFGLKMQAFKEKNELTLTQITEETGLHRSTWFRAVAGNVLDIDSVITLCEWMGTPITSYIKKKKTDETTKKENPKKGKPKKDKVKS